MTCPDATAGDSGDLQRLTRWEVAGGLWEVVSRTPRAVTISLRRCDGGEEVDRFTTSDPLVLGHLACRARSDD
ncbi:MAG: hypothetical protein M3Y71_00585 [Actinomycetota bacterium]|nr:hypothetical protein [Actinomycetota bacterium]